MRAALLAILLLAGCSRSAAPVATTSNTTGLEAAAIQSGVIPDPADIDLTGLYRRETDRICIVPAASDYRIGIAADYDAEQGCGAGGAAVRDGDTIHVTIDDAPGCRFDARFEGDRISLPGQLPEGCHRACTSRASLAGLSVNRLSDSASEAATMRDRKGRLLCAS